MRTVIALLSILVPAGCTHQPRPDQPDLADLIADVRQDVPIRAGWTVERVKRYVAANNQRVHEDDVRSVEKFEPPAYSRPDLRLYVFIEMKDRLPSDGRSITYLVNGRHQFWMDLGIEDNAINNIYVAPGNMTYIIYPAVLFDGTGEHVGRLADTQQ